MKKLLLTSVTALLLATGTAHAQKSHMTAEEITRGALALQTPQNVQNFAVQFKRNTGDEFNEQMVLILKLVADGAAVDISMAEVDDIAPTTHDPRHCRVSNGDKLCFESWSYDNIKSQMLMKRTNVRRTKIIQTDVFGHEEAISFCSSSRNDVSTCVIDVNMVSIAYRFSIMGSDQRDIARIYWPADERKGSRR